MTEVTFLFEGAPIQILCQKEDKMDSICKKFATKIKGDVNNFIFLYDGNQINKDLNFEEQAGADDKKRQKMSIIAKNMNEDDSSKENPNKISEEIICPECLEPCHIKIEDYKISLYGCKKGHKTEKILFKNFINTQIIDESKILCGFCDKNKSQTYNRDFYKCFDCNKNLCPTCKSKHPSEHKQILNYSEINYKCGIHSEKFISFCDKCRQNLCFMCQSNHDNTHEIKPFINIMPNIDMDKAKLILLKDKINNIEKIIEEAIKIFFEVKENINAFSEIYRKILDNYNHGNRNYQIIQNINTFKDFDIINDINKIHNEKSFSNRIIDIINIFNKIKERTEIKIRYKIDQREEKIKIFDSDFVKNNKKLCKIIYKKKEYELSEYFNNPKDNDIFEISLAGINKIKDMNSMFYGCSNLVSLPNLSEWNTYNVEDMGKAFRGCSSLEYISKELPWNTINVKNMESLFYGCTSLKNIPDISSWDTSNVKNMNEMFLGCTGIKKLPDISRWNTTNIKKLAKMFKGCTSLEILPDISKWNVSNCKDFKELFSGCKNLKELPDLSKWETESLTNMDCIFSGCSSLKQLPDISKWDTSNVNFMGSVFSDCSSLVELPDLSKWKTNNVVDMSCLFSGCSNLLKIPDISKWNMKHVTKIGSMFSCCSKIDKLPDISLWNTSNITFMGCLFNGCTNLAELPDISKWDMSKVSHIGCMFAECSSLVTMPDISKWDTNNIIDMSCLFSGCTKLTNMPELKKWSTRSLKKKNSMFNGCRSLNSEITKYNPDEDCIIF